MLNVAVSTLLPAQATKSTAYSWQIATSLKSLVTQKRCFILEQYIKCMELWKRTFEQLGLCFHCSYLFNLCSRKLNKQSISWKMISVPIKETCLPGVLTWASCHFLADVAPVPVQYSWQWWLQGSCIQMECVGQGKHDSAITQIKQYYTISKKNNVRIYFYIQSGYYFFH